MNRTLDAVFAGPGNHSTAGDSIFHTAQTDFAEELHTGGGKFLEIVFDHALFKHRRAGIDLHTTRAKRMEGTLREDGHRFQADDVLRTAGRVHLPRRDHGGNTTVQAALDPAELVLAGRP